MIGKILKNPVTILLSVILGVLFGFYYKNIALLLGAIGDVYLNFFQMTVIPILVTSIVASLAQLMKNQKARAHITRIIIVFIIMLLIIAVFGTVIGIATKPGKDLGDATTEVLDKIIKTSEKASSNEIALKNPGADVGVQKTSLFDFFLHLVPSNIFTSFSSGRILEIVFFSIIFGIALGFINDASSTRLVNATLSFKESFQKLINWTMYGLPFGLVFLIGKQIAQVGVEILLAMVKFIVIFYIAGACIFIICTVLIWIRSGIKNPLKVLRKLLDPIIICLATRNSFAALPSSVEALTELNFNTTTVNLVFPLGVTILRFGNIMYFAIASCFVAQIYGTQFGATSVMIVVVGSLLAGTATAGASGLLTLPMLSLILDPLGLPVESILVVFMAIDSLIDPMRTFLIVYTNIATTALISERGQTEKVTEREAEDKEEIIPESPVQAIAVTRPLSIPQPVVVRAAAERAEKKVPVYRQKPHVAENVRKQSIKIRIRDALVLINTLLIVATAVIIININSRGTQDSVYSISDKLVTEILNSVVNKIEAYYTPAEQSVHDIGFHYWNESTFHFRENKEAAINYFLETLQTHREFVMVYFADTDGNLIMGRRMPDGTLSKRYISRTENSVKTQYVHENKEYNASYPNTVENIDKGYDPRTRGWYKEAIAKRGLVWTDVYIFATDNMPGFSCALPIYQDNGTLEGVACIDIGIRDLSLYLGTLVTTANSRLFVYDENNQIIAKPILSGESLDILFNITTKADGTNSYTLKKTDDAGDPVTAAAYAAGRNKINAPGVFSFSTDGNKFFSKIAGIDLKKGLSMKIAMIIPDMDIMGIVYFNNKVVLVFSLLVIIAAIIISIMVSALISQPMKILSTEMNGIRELNISDDVKIKSGISEIDGMVSSFQGMKRGLTNFKKYVPADLVNILIKNNQDASIGGEKQVVTLFFSDIENFTGISENVAPEDLVNRLYEYFSTFEHTIHENNGTLDKYIGDSIMAFWGAPIPMDIHEHARLACRSALICQTLGFNLSNTWAREGKARFRTRMGIHTGEVIVGNMGSNERINYTVLGDSVNLASRLEGINKYYGTEIIVSDSTHDLVKDDFEFRLLDKITVKGKTKPLYIYELLAEKDKLDRNMLKVYRYYENGLLCYFKGEWDNTIKYMDIVLQSSNDKPAGIIRERTLKYRANPPSNWNGIYAFDKK